MKYLITIMVLVISSGMAVVVADNPSELDEPSKADMLAVESLTRSVIGLLHSPASTTARAGRIVILARAAGAIAPASATSKLLADIYAVQGDVVAASKHAHQCIEANPLDHAAGKRYILLSLATMQKADARGEFLISILNRDDLPDELKAVAASYLATLRLGQGKNDRAGELFEKIRSLDAHCPALADLLQVEVIAASYSPSQRIEIYLDIFQSHCWRYDLIWDSASICSEMGLGEEAIELLEFYRTLRGGFTEERAKSAEFHELPELPTYCNALLDAAKPEQVVRLLAAKEAKDKSSGEDITLPLIEAYRLLNQPEKVKSLVDKLEKSLKDRLADEHVSTELASELAWFYLTVKLQKKQALTFAKTALAGAKDNKIAQRIYALALLQSGQGGQAVPLLEKLIDSDQYAAAYLGEYYLAQGDKVKAGKALLAGAKLANTGPAWRKLRQVASGANIKIPADDGAKDAKLAILAASASMKLALKPNDAIEITLKPIKQKLLLCEPVEVEVTITNKSDQSLALSEGLVLPAVAMTVKINERIFANLPVATLLAPAYLKAGESVSVITSLDVAQLDSLLISNPLSEFTLEINGKIQSQPSCDAKITTINIKPIIITRAPLVFVPDGVSLTVWGKVYKRMIESLNRSLTESDKSHRILITRQIASLVTMLRKAEAENQKLPKGFALAYSRDDLLSLTKKALADQSPVIRAEMLAGLKTVKLDESLLQLLIPSFKDASWLVRLRVVELIGASRSKGSKTILDYFTQDKHRFVKELARDFLSQGLLDDGKR